MAKRKSFLMRIDPLLWKEIEAWAHQDLRSVNGQIEFLLRDALRKRGLKPPPRPGSAGDEESNGEAE